MMVAIWLISHKDSQLRNMPFIIIHCKILALFVNGILRNWESSCDIRPDCHHHFDASRDLTSTMSDELAERSLMSPLAGSKRTYVRLAIIIHSKITNIDQEYMIVGAHPMKHRHSS